jgi:ubiquinone biosynthesis protein
MVGRFDEDIRKSMLAYYYSLVMGDAVNAARYLTSVAVPGRGSDVKGFRRAVEDTSRRWARSANFDDFSLARLIMESVILSGQYRMYFPVEMILMVKALVTFEGVGNMLEPGFDVAAVSQKYIRAVLLKQFNPIGIVKETMPGMPELIDTFTRSPIVLAEAFRLLEKTVKNPTPNPLMGIKGTMFAGFCLVAGAIIASFGGPWPVWGALFILAIIVALKA